MKTLYVRDRNQWRSRLKKNSTRSKDVAFVSVPATDSHAEIGYCEARSRAGLLHLGKGLFDFLEVRDNRDVVLLEPGELALFIDDGDRAPGDAFIF